LTGQEGPILCFVPPSGGEGSLTSKQVCRRGNVTRTAAVSFKAVFRVNRPSRFASGHNQGRSNQEPAGYILTDT
jgi:hypothetical protein